MSHLALIKPARKAIHTNYQTLQDYSEHHVEHETTVRSAFQNLLADIAKTHHWLLVPEQSTRVGGKRVEYRLGNRSALEWVIDQYPVCEDKRSGNRSDPNRADVSEFIVRPVGPVVSVSLETVRVVAALPESYSGG